MSIDPVVMRGFLRQLTKEAGVLQSVGSALGHLRVPTSLNAVRQGLQGRYGRQLLVGAGVGAAGGALADPENRMRGMSRGALLGAGLTGAGQLATAKGRAAAGTAIKNVGTKAKYQFLGKGVEDVATAKRVGLLGAEPSAADMAAFTNKWDNIPGVVRGMAKQPGAVLKNSWDRMSTVGKVFTGLTAADIGREALTSTAPGGPGRAERVLGSAAGTLGYAVAPAGLLASTALGSTAAKIGKGTGRLLDRGVAKISPPSTTQQIAALPDAQFGGM